MASVDDAQRLLNIYRPYVERTAVSFEYTVPELAEFQRRMVHTLEKYPYLVAEDETGIVGYAYASAFHERRAYQHGAELSVYVAWNCRRGGVGRRLYAEMAHRLSQQNVYAMYACIASTDRAGDEYLSADSVCFHEHMGFRCVAKFASCGYKFDRWYDMVWMEKRILPPPEHPEPFVPLPEIEKR